MSQNTAKPLSFPVPFADVPYYLVFCQVEREAATRVLGPPAMTAWVDGLGDADFWAFEYPCGLQVAYQFQHWRSRGGLLLADSPEINHVLRHIPFAASDCSSIDDETLQSELRTLLKIYPHRKSEIETLHAFQVWRNGDDGNAFAVGEATSERDAKCWIQHFESLGHKQCYWYTQLDG